MNQDSTEPQKTIQPPVEIVIPPSPQPNSTIRPSEKKAPLYGSVGADPQGMDKIPTSVRSAVMWIVSGPVVLFVLIVLNVIVNLLIPNGSIIATLVDIVLWAGALVGIALLVVGPVIGIIKLIKN